MESTVDPLQQAMELHQSGDVRAAVATYEQIVRADPHHADALHLLGLAALHCDQFEEAVDFITRAIKSNGTFAPYYSNLGVASLKLGNREQALLCFQQSLDLDSQFADAHFNLGTLHFDGKDWQTAAACYDRGLRIDGDDLQVWQNRGLIHEVEGEFDRARECYRQVLRLNPDATEAKNDLQRVDAAQQAATASPVEIPPTPTPNYGTLDLSAFESKPIENAQTAEDHCRAAEHFFHSGQVDNAVDSYRKAIRVDPDHAESFIGLGRALENRGQRGEVSSTRSNDRQVFDGIHR